MMLALLILSIALAGIVVFQFAYMAFLHANNRHLREQLAKPLHNKSLKEAASITPLLSKATIASGDDSWPEFIEHEQLK